MAAGVAGLRPGVTGAARRSEEQVEVMHALWVEPHVTFKGKWHTIEDMNWGRLPCRAGSQLSYRMIDPVFINLDYAGARRGRSRRIAADGDAAN